VSRAPGELPAGRYLSCAFRVSPDAGGQTRAMLARNRSLATLGGVRPDVLTFGAARDHDERRAQLLARGLLIESVGMLNLYEHFREHGWGEEPSGGAPLPDLGAHRTAEETALDGSAWRISYRDPGSRRTVYDYLRPDGSPYLRVPAFGLSRKASWPKRILRVGADGTIAGEFRSVGQWFRRWIRDLAAGHERAFVFMDSRFLVPHVAPMRGRRIHLIYQMHNMHVQPPFHWDSPASDVYERVLARIGGLDAMVTLTERQGEDIAARIGRRSNMFVVANPIEPPPPPRPEPVRDPSRLTIVGRLATQKRLTHAIAAFEQVRAAVPSARLDVYGEGPERERLQAEIDRRGLGGTIVLHGHDPRASEALWTSSAFLMTSLFEGYPLSTLESLSRGCPVVSYDIKFGPREQLTDGVEGFLVPDGDVARFAERVIELLRSPELVRRMSAAGRQTARRYGPAEILERWAHVVHAAVEQKPERTRIARVDFELGELRTTPAGRVTRRGLLPRRVPARGELAFAAVLRVDGRSRRSDLGSAELTLAATDRRGALTELPLSVRRDGSRFAVHARARPSDDLVGLRLRLVWQNSAWQTRIEIPPH